MKLSRKWINEDFVDLSQIDDHTLIQTLIRAGLTIRSWEVLDINEESDTLIEIDVPFDRPDLCSVIGLAREISAIFDRPFRYHEPVVNGCDRCSIYELLDVDVPADELCNRYTARIVKNIKIAQSPDWLRQRLLSSGIQPIINLIDIANYVMLEYGQPIDIIDYGALSYGNIIVREAENFESITAPDGKQHSLHPGMLVLADEVQVISLAGIVNNKNYELTIDTHTLVIAAANYNAVNIEETASTLGLHTNASIRYTKGLDCMMTMDAIQRACELVEILECGDVIDGVIDILNYVPFPITLELDTEEINRLLDFEIPEAQIMAYLNRLGISIDGQNIALPSFRQDLRSIADVAKEIKRLHSLS